ncbi:MAG: hypothetical protein FWD23_12320 [Oscillospiraceae bacterium]|nr:hypothetical protein [Oscillospiraceae bacterium]
MKTLKQTVSIVLMLAFGGSAVCNILLILKKISLGAAQAGFFVLLSVVFLVSVFGIALKNIRKDNRVTVNILTPAEEFGALYAFVAAVWVITYFIAIIFFK